MLSIITFLFSFLFNSPVENKLLAPINIDNRHNIERMELTEIGYFGLQRKERPTVAAHLHTGIDIKRANGNYRDAPIFPVADGIVISKREDGPYAQLILEHDVDGLVFWTVYEHIAGIEVELNDWVTNDQRMARFFNTAELDKHGWQFDHFHFEVIKKRPLKIAPTTKNPHRHFSSYSLICFDEQTLFETFYDPISFLSQ